MSRTDNITYSKSGLLQIIKQNLNLGASNINEYKFKMQRIQFDALKDLREETLEFSTIKARKKFLSQIIEDVKLDYNNLNSEKDEFSKVLCSVTEEFISEAKILNRFFEFFPPSSKLTNDAEIYNTLERPLAFLESLVNDEIIKSLKEKFYLFHETYGCSSHHGDESVTNSFFIEDFDEHKFESLDNVDKKKYILEINDPKNTVIRIHYFKDELKTKTVQNIESSKRILKELLLKNPKEESQCLDEVQNILNGIMKSTSDELRKYPKVIAKLKTFQNAVKLDKGNVFLNYISSGLEIIPTLTFKLGDNHKHDDRGTDLLKDFFNSLIIKSFIDCSLDDLLKVFKGPTINKKIRWYSSTRALHFIIRNLIKNGDIQTLSNKNDQVSKKVIQNCFIKTDGEPFTDLDFNGIKTPVNLSNLLVICNNFG